jgi:hypothetical protein
MWRQQVYARVAHVSDNKCTQPKATGETTMPMPTPDVSFTKYVNIYDKVYIDKTIDVDVWVKGNSAIANATADAFGKNTHSETLTQTVSAEGEYSGSVSESVSASTKDFHFHW